MNNKRFINEIFNEEEYPDNYCLRNCYLGKFDDLNNYGYYRVGVKHIKKYGFKKALYLAAMQKKMYSVFKKESEEQFYYPSSMIEMDTDISRMSQYRFGMYFIEQNLLNKVTEKEIKDKEYRTINYYSLSKNTSINNKLFLIMPKWMIRPIKYFGFGSKIGPILSILVKDTIEQNRKEKATKSGFILELNNCSTSINRIAKSLRFRKENIIEVINKLEKLRIIEKEVHNGIISNYKINSVFYTMSLLAHKAYTFSKCQDVKTLKTYYQLKLGTDYSNDSEIIKNLYF